MTVLITGANRGIGLQMAHDYAKAGETVIGTMRRTAPDETGIRWEQLEVTDPKSHAALALRLDRQPIDLLICNAGVYLDKHENLADGYDAEMWAKSFAVNVTGVFQTVQNLLPHLQMSHAPKIAIISSQMASDTRAPGGSYIYRSSKAAALNLGRNLAADLKDLGVAVGIYHPGWVQTDMGGGNADISVQQAADGLRQRFAALCVDTTGCFETYDGKTHAY
ncbi:SDR family NAD(P)-dependent oxidoreductase [Actibacterium lipolyticum]|uniref:C-factor n=1 Tax=Actibacterium lipolyticum TaxID=1524263 RepID=A0A238KM94_9RHOB|nr:SDR family NAD(P)-dependent oxidoreductase [Actibacterium lipolyticum]SMX43863.1 C-factor [Actibacterium lipolyticum]